MLLQKYGLQEKRNTKSLSMSPPRKDLITNQDITRIITQQDATLPPILAKWPTGYKPSFDDTHFQVKQRTNIMNFTYNSRNENGDSVNNLNVKRMKIRIMNTKKIIQKLLKVMEV